MMASNLTMHRTILDEINLRLNQRGIHHVTFQLEPRPLHQLAPQEAEAGSDLGSGSGPG